MKRFPGLTDIESTVIGGSTGLASRLDVGEMVVRIMSGKMAGKEFTFLIGQSIIIGRQDDSHICLNHNLVSRHHSKIHWKGNVAYILDLKSTNGTYLNGDRIIETTIQDGDRLQVGNSVMKIMFHYQSKSESSPTDDDSRVNQLVESASHIHPRKIFSGSLDKIPLCEILQSISLSKRGGIMRVKSEHKGKIYIRDGSIFFARVGEVKGKKALFRILNWGQGTFDLQELPEDLSGDISPNEMADSDIGPDFTQLMLEYFKFQDEFETVRKRAPGLKDKLKVNLTKGFPQKKGLERVMAIYKGVAKYPRVENLLDQFPLIDTEILRVLAFLLERGFLVPPTS